MALNGKQKAAMLLVSLDPETATELLRGLPAEEIEQIGIELAELDASGQNKNRQTTEIVQEFAQSVTSGQTQEANIKSFLNETLLSLVSKEQAERIQSKIKKASQKTDPFADIRAAESDKLAFALEGEPPQAIAAVLSEITPKKAQEVLSLLNEETQPKVVCGMTNQDGLRGAVRGQIASMVSTRLKSFEGEIVLEKPGKREENLRKLALVLSGLETPQRDKLLEELKKRDEETASMVRKLMVTWQDIPSIADRSLQEALRGVEAKVLAVALHGADEEIAEKIRSNISERAAASVDEEASLMQEPLPKEILEAREEVVGPLREANEQDKLRFVQR